MTDLTRTRTVLPLASDLQDSEGAAYFQATPDEEPSPCRVRVHPDVWEDMGRPTEITVTIEPGDLLNDGDGPDPDNFRGSGVAIGEPLP